MSRQARTTRTTTATPSAAEIPIFRFVGWDHEVVGANGNVMGISCEHVGVGENGLIALGETAVVEAGAPLDGTEQRLKSDANGRAIPWAAGTDITAAMLRPGQTAAAVGDPVEVHIIQSVPTT